MMKTVMNKMLLALAVMSATSAVNAATVTDRVSGTADIVFNQPANPLKLTITPRTGLVAGDYSVTATEAADFTVTSDREAMLAVAWTEGFAGQQPQGVRAVISGTNDPDNNKASFYLAGDNGTSTIPVDNVDWSVYKESTEFKGFVVADSQINADTYRISIDAAVYNM